MYASVAGGSLVDRLVIDPLLEASFSADHPPHKIELEKNYSKIRMLITRCWITVGKLSICRVALSFRTRVVFRRESG